MRPKTSTTGTPSTNCSNDHCRDGFMVAPHSLRWIIITAVAFVVLGVSLINRVILQTTFVGSVEPKSTNVTVILASTPTILPINDHVAIKHRKETRRENDRNVTLVVQLPQTLGRALDVIAAARVVKSMARRNFSIDTQLLLRVHASPRGRTTALHLQSCFPNLLQSSEFQIGSILELDERTRQMNERWENSNVSGPMVDLAVTNDGVRQTLQLLQSMLEEEPLSRGLYPSSNATISVPFLQINKTFQSKYLVDTSNLDDIRSLLTFVGDECCSLLPEPDETVLHVWGYRRRRSWIKQNELDQLSPSKAANELLGHLPNGSKVAIVSTFRSDGYVSALQARGLLARIVSQRDIQDFCFLSRAKKELVTERVSSFSVWAATLNTEVQSVRFYEIQSSNGDEQPLQTTVSWLPPVPGSRIHYIKLEADQNSTSSIGKSKKERLGGQSLSPKRNGLKSSLGEVPPVTIVVQLSGEMGNNIAKLATGKGLQLWAQRQYGITTDLVLRHQEHPKWVKGMRDLKKCFPHLRGFDFELGNGPNYNERTAQQQQLLGNKSALLRLTTARVGDIEETLSTLRGIQPGTKGIIVQGSSSNITLPFLLADHLALIDVWADKFYDDYRQFFEFDYKECCKTKADPGESVFHFRNYVTEMPEYFKEFGFEELSPNKTANELFRNLKAGDKIAITSRFISDPKVNAYVDALTSRGIQVRVIEGQTGVEDFCFLLSARKELVGFAESSYAAWAGYLGNANKVRLYSVDSPARRADGSLFHHRVFYHFNWTNPKLQRRVFFELYGSEDGS